MQIAEIVALVIAGVGLLSLGLLVLTRDTKQWALRWFFVLCCAVSLWSWGVAWYVGASNVSTMLISANFYYACALAISVSIFVFSHEWLHSKHHRRWVTLSLGVVLCFIGLLILRPNTIVQNISLVHGRSVTLNPLAYSLYAAAFLVLFGMAILRLCTRLSRLQGLYRTQTTYIMAGLVWAGLFGASFNLILPWFGNYSLVWIGPLSALIFAAFVSYAIVRQKLFDIRAFVVRAVAYLFSTALLSLVYIVPSVLFMAAILHVQFSWVSLFWAVVAVILFALIYGRIRDSFNNLTNRIFFRGYYEPQDVLNRLSEILVRSIDAGYIKLHSSRILREAIKPGRLDFWLATDADYEAHQPAALAKLFRSRSASNVFVTSEHALRAELAEYLLQEDIAVIVRLQTASTDLGFLVLGFKSSGAAYNERDRRLLGIASDEIAIALQNALHFQQIQHFNETLQERVAQATNELRRSNEKLKALDETKDEFITMASHQLRTPLTSVKGYLSMVLEGDAGKLTTHQEQLLRQSYASSQRMVFLISDLLNLSRLNTGKFVIETTAVDLCEIVQSELEQLDETAKSREVQLVYDGAPAVSKLLLDETKIHQVVMNFIDNAIYYTPAGGKIVVSLTETPTAVEFRVKDNGIGVPRAVQHKLFSKFFRATNAQRARPDGTGLGLFMAKKVILAQGGSIIFESEEGKGSTFGFHFSKANRLAPEPATLPTK